MRLVTSGIMQALPTGNGNRDISTSPVNTSLQCNLSKVSDDIYFADFSLST